MSSKSPPKISKVSPKFVIVGAGIVGSAIAASLARRLGPVGAREVCVLDPSLEGRRSSTELNAGGVRATWRQSINIELSRDSIRYFQTLGARVGYHPCGYLWLKTPKGMEENLQYFELQRQMGWEVEKWEVSDLRKKAPFLDKTEDLGGAYFGVNDGLINPNTLKLHYREEALRLGVRFMDHTALVGAHEIVQAQNANGERILDEYLKSGESSYLRNSDTGLVRFELQVPHGGAIVNAAGPWAAQVAKALGYQRPTFALRRQIFLFESRTLDLSSYGMVVDTSGVYFHPEASFILGGVSNRDEKPGFSFETSGEEFFQERIWEPLFHRGSGFEELKLRTHWAGLYEMSPDESGIVGSVKPGVYEAHSFSGHGVMQSYAVGERLAEEILGSGPGIPELKGDRFERGALIQESAVI